MSELYSVTIHVPNVWQTCEWYRQVFDLAAALAPDAASARLDVSGQVLTFAAHDIQETDLGPRRRNSFLSDPPAFHLEIATADVQALFNRAIAFGAVPVYEPCENEGPMLMAGLRDLNGILIRLVSLDAKRSNIVELST